MTDITTLEEDYAIKEDCLRLKAAGWPLRKIKAFLEKQGRNVGLNTISDWIREAAAIKHESDGHTDFKVQKMMGISEIEELILEVKAMIDNKVIRYEVPLSETTDETDPDFGKMKVFYKEVSPMVMAQLYSTLESLTEKKNAIRGLTSKVSLTQFNQYNIDANATDDELVKEFGKGNPRLLGRLSALWGESGKVAQGNGNPPRGEVIEVTDESN